MEQGSFLKCDEFDIYDKKLQRKYKGKVFLFAKSVVYTETIKYDEKRVNTHYRGNYHYQKLGISRRDKDLSKVSLFVEKRGNSEIELSHFSTNIIDIWVQLITKKLLMASVAEGNFNLYFFYLMILF